jgi:hypothetical protein
MSKLDSEPQIHINNVALNIDADLAADTLDEVALILSICPYLIDYTVSVPAVDVSHLPIRHNSESASVISESTLFFIANLDCEVESRSVSYSVFIREL